MNPDGTERWRRHTGGCTASSPVLDADDNLYFSANKAHLSLGRDGKIRWQREIEVMTDTSPAVAANGEVYFSLPWLRIGGFRTDGQFLWAHSITNNLTSSPNIGTNGVLYAGGGFQFFALQPATNAAPPAKSSWPLWRANPQHTGRAQK